MTLATLPSLSGTTELDPVDTDSSTLLEFTTHLQAALDVRRASARRLREALERAERDIQRLEEVLAARQPERAVSDDSAPSESARVVGYAKRLLLEAGRPLTRTEIFRAMQADGCPPASPKPERFIGRALWRSAGFIHVKGGYWVADRPIP